MSAFLYGLSPDAAVLLLTLGIALIAIELNRPGSILPGALGLLLALLAVACLLHQQPGPAAVALLIASAAALLLQLRLRIPIWAAALATLALIAGLRLLLHTPGQRQVHLATAVPCGLILGAGTTLLTRLARRAHLNKGLD